MLWSFQKFAHSVVSSLRFLLSMTCYKKPESVWRQFRSALMSPIWGELFSVVGLRLLRLNEIKWSCELNVAKLTESPTAIFPVMAHRLTDFCMLIHRKRQAHASSLIPQSSMLIATVLSGRRSRYVNSFTRMRCGG